MLRDATISLELGGQSVAFYIDSALPYLESSDTAAYGTPGLESVEAASSAVTSRIVIEGEASLGASPYIELAIRLGVLRMEAFPLLLESLLGSDGAGLLAPLKLEGIYQPSINFKECHTMHQDFSWSTMGSWMALVSLVFLEGVTGST
ncbi:hypothetical protein MASR2M48_27810 [Spirochaetota bacterium]